MRDKGHDSESAHGIDGRAGLRDEDDGDGEERGKKRRKITGR